MVRTKLCPTPFFTSSNKTIVRIGNESNYNGVKGSTFDLPKRVKLKARRRFTEKSHFQKISDASNSTDVLFKSSPRYAKKNCILASISTRHKRQKSLHNILTKINVNI
jgi:hypothetical protein